MGLLPEDPPWRSKLCSCQPKLNKLNSPDSPRSLLRSTRLDARRPPTHVLHVNQFSVLCSKYHDCQARTRQMKGRASTCLWYIEVICNLVPPLCSDLFNHESDGLVCHVVLARSALDPPGMPLPGCADPPHHEPPPRAIYSRSLGGRSWGGRTGATQSVRIIELTSLSSEGLIRTRQSAIGNRHRARI